MKLHTSGEEYLEAVLILQKKQGMVRSIDLARNMGIIKPGISHAGRLLFNKRISPAGCSTLSAKERLG